MPTIFGHLLNTEDEQTEIFTLLRATPIFHRLSPRELRRMESILHERSFQPNEIVFEQGEEGLGLYVVRSGRIRVSRIEKGGEQEIAVLARGSFFGELALLDGSPRSAQARALEQSELIGFFRPDLIQLFDTCPGIAAKVSFELAKWIGSRLRDTLKSSPQSLTL